MQITIICSYFYIEQVWIKRIHLPAVLVVDAMSKVSPKPNEILKFSKRFCHWFRNYFIIFLSYHLNSLHGVKQEDILMYMIL
jgi:hypothetical protein